MRWNTSYESFKLSSRGDPCTNCSQIFTNLFFSSIKFFILTFCFTIVGDVFYRFILAWLCVQNIKRSLIFVVYRNNFINYYLITIITRRFAVTCFCPRSAVGKIEVVNNSFCASHWQKVWTDIPGSTECVF